MTIQIAAIVEIIKLVSVFMYPIRQRIKSRKELENIISRRIDRLLNKTSNKLLLRALGLTSTITSTKIL
jgi:hypothetical protein